MVISLIEVFDLVVMTAALGYIFMDTFKKPNQDPIHFYSKPGFNWDDFWYACMVVAPSIILHEMAHKFVALAQGMTATFHAAYTWLGVGVLLKLMNFGFIFFVPGYVSISGIGTHLQFALISFVGPLVHLILWLGGQQYMKNNPRMKNSKKHFWVMVVQINKFLFILNMLPIPGFDGFGVYSNLFNAFA